MSEYNFQQLQKEYEQMTAHVDCHCVAATKIVGGQPADEIGVRAFVQHHLKLTGDEAEGAVRRILKEEVGEHDTTPENGELKEKQVYGVNIIRRDSFGPYLGDWMVKACIKQAASRIGIFKEQRGSKGNFAEAGKVMAICESLKDVQQPNHIYLTNGNGEVAHTHFETFQGRVSGPMGAKSIMHDSEVADAGSRFAFRFHFLQGQIKEEDIVDLFSLAMVCGLGSVRSLECGKFRIEKLIIELQAK